MRDLERCGANDLRHGATPQTLRADEHRFVRAARRRDLDALQVRLELAAGDASDLRTDATEVLLLTAGGNLVAELSGLAANATLPCHLSTSPCVRNRDDRKRVVGRAN